MNGGFDKNHLAQCLTLKNQRQFENTISTF